MKISDYIVNTINRFPKGFVFTYEEFSKQVESKEAIIKALNRMAVSGRLKNWQKESSTSQKKPYLENWNRQNYRL